jgi:protein ImuA
MTRILPLAAFARRRTLPAPLPPAQAAAWRPGLGEGGRHAEVFAPAGEGSGAALALALALDAAAAGEARPFLWVQDRAALRLGGRPYRPGLPAALRARLIHVAAKSPEDALFALEEGLRCRDLAFVLGEVAGNPRALDFTASRRLSLAAEKHGNPLWLVRLEARRDLSSARLRWQARAAPSAPPRWNAEAPGTPAWRAELFRARSHPPGEWILRDDGHVLSASPPHPRDLAGEPGDRSLATG